MLFRNNRHGLLDVVGAVEMGVVDAGEIFDACTAFNRVALIEQHTDAHPFQPGHILIVS